MPFAGYKNFATCVAANKDKKNPEAYCASIMTAVEDKGVETSYEINTKIRNYGDTDVDGHIRINPKKGDVVNTIIHENLHNADWEMEHEKVYKLAAKIESQMSLPEMAQLLVDTHAKAQSPKKGFDIKHTEVSKVVKSNIKK